VSENPKFRLPLFLETRENAAGFDGVRMKNSKSLPICRFEMIPAALPSWLAAEPFDAS